MTSRIHRHVVHRVKEVLNMPDGYYSMGRIHRKIKPAAILDIGANHGYTVDKLLDYAPGAKIHAYEPTPGSAAVLRGRMKGRPDVQVHEIALGESYVIVSIVMHGGDPAKS